MPWPNAFASQHKFSTCVNLHRFASQFGRGFAIQILQDDTLHTHSADATKYNCNFVVTEVAPRIVQVSHCAYFNVQIEMTKIPSL